MARLLHGQKGDCVVTLGYASTREAQKDIGYYRMHH
jgi:hypothetical protein